VKIFGREPAAILATVAAFIQFISLFVVELTTDQQAVLNAVVVAAFGVITSFAVSAEKGLPTLVGLAQSVIALAIGFGADFSAEQQVGLMALVTTAVGLFVRTQVVAPVAPSGVAREVPATKINRQTGGSLG
jgi:nicotinamide riboside transporter PnuC